MDLTLFKKICHEICDTENYRKMKNYCAHGNISVYAHSINVAFIAYRHVIKHNVKCDVDSLIKGALLHDYYLYDWHLNHKFYFHGLRHPFTAYKNAERDYIINKKVRNIIRSHMFPLLFFMLPLSKEAWIVSMSDKKASIREMKKGKKK